MAISADNPKHTKLDKVTTAVYAALLQQDSMTYHMMHEKPMLDRAAETAEEIFEILGIEKED